MYLPVMIIIFSLFSFLLKFICITHTIFWFCVFFSHSILPALRMHLIFVSWRLINSTLPAITAQQLKLEGIFFFFLQISFSDMQFKITSQRCAALFSSFRSFQIYWPVQRSVFCFFHIVGKVHLQFHVQTIFMTKLIILHES